jgi:large subunit ribosomal protein L5
VINCWTHEDRHEIFALTSKGRLGTNEVIEVTEEALLSRLRDKYDKEVVPAMTEEFKYKSIMAVPRLEKVVLNMGLGEAIFNIKVLDKGVEELTLIAGQKAVITKAKKSIAGFKLREGMPIGCAVTLRRDRMYDFLDKLFNVALPRVRDFRGISDKIFDGRANCTIGIKEHIIFPEIDYDKIDKIKGLNVSMITSAQTDAEGYLLLKLLGMPFRQ